MATKYAALTQHLQTALPEDEVILDVTTLAQMVGGLPESSSSPSWWANTVGHVQAQAWLMTGRKVLRVKEGRIVFSIAGTPISGTRSGAPITRAPAIMDGVTSLATILQRAGYASIVAAVSEHTIFLDPRTVAQTNGRAVFPVIRDMSRRGTFDDLPDGRRVLLDDNTTPTLTFLWAASRTRGLDVQYNHVWTEARDPALYTALWNICVTPAFLAKTTDGKNHPDVRAALQYRAYDLYGAHPLGRLPERPSGFDKLQWAPMPDPVLRLEAAFRARLATSPKSRPALAARSLGWLFSNGEPDMLAWN